VAQQQVRRAQSNPSVQPDLKTVYQKWLDEDVVYIITAEESRAFLMLTTDGERERFIEQFWRARNPNSATGDNAYRAEHYRRMTRHGRDRMPVAVAIGADPAVMYAALLPLPPDLDEMMIAGFLREKPVEMVKCETVDVEVPANAEIVLEGYVDTEELRAEGPFGDHTGYYSLEDEFPVFHVTCITHRKKPIYQTIIVGKPPQEDCWMGEAIERIYLPLMQRQFPEVADYHMPFAGVFHNLMIVAIRKDYPGHARKIMNGIWSLPQAMFTKCIVVVDNDTNVRDLNEVAWRVLNNIDPERDIQFMAGPVDQLDHSSRLPNFGSKMGIDGTRKWKSEGFDRPWPKEIKMSENVKRRIDQLWPKLGL